MELGGKKGGFFPQIFETRAEEVFGRMVEQTIEGWLTVLEKKGLRQAANGSSAVGTMDILMDR